MALSLALAIISLSLIIDIGDVAVYTSVGTVFLVFIIYLVALDSRHMRNDCGDYAWKLYRSKMIAKGIPEYYYGLPLAGVNDEGDADSKDRVFLS